MTLVTSSAPPEIRCTGWNGFVVGFDRPLILGRWNEIEVVVIGTLKNTLGPHHGKPGLGRAWPGMFQRGPNPGPPPGADYATVGYGLFEPLVLKQATRSSRVSASALRSGRPH